MTGGGIFPSSSPRSGGARSSFDVTIAVWKALFFREAISRLAAGRGAWFWLLAEPVAHVAVLMAVFSLLRDRVVPGVSFALFLMTGVVSFNLLRHAAKRSVGAVQANTALFSYRQVLPADTVLVRIALESVLQLIVLTVLCLGAALLGMKIAPANPLLLGVSIVLLIILGAGLALLFSCGAHLLPEFGKVVGLVFTPLYFVSGVMFPPVLVPAGLRELFFMNPVAHALEGVRAGFFETYPVARELDLMYLASWGAVTVFLGLLFHVRFARRLVAR